MSEPLKKAYGYLARFESPKAVYQAAMKVRDRGFKRWDVYSPFPIHGMDDAMGLSRSKIPWVVFFGGMAGTATGILLQYLTQVVIYPTIVQAKPANIFTIPAFFPVIFELTILLSAFTTLFSLLGFTRLPYMNHPLFTSAQFKKATDDGLFIAIEAVDGEFHEEETRTFLEEIGGQDIELVEDEV
ncbi:MAG: DUF3341 domain-containing protein [Verrucomicrobiota bacterium]